MYSNNIIFFIVFMNSDVVIGFSQTSYTTSEGRSQLEVTVCVLEGHISGSHLVTFNSADGTAIGTLFVH